MGLAMLYFFFCNFLTPITLFVSYISLVFASVDRYVALTFPFKYRQINSIKIAKVVSVLVWILSAVVQPITYIFTDRENYCWLFQPNVETGVITRLNQMFTKTETYSLNGNVTAATLLTLFGLLWTINLLTFYSLYQNHKKSVHLNRKFKKGLSTEKQMSLILIFMVLAFTVSLSPTIYSHICVYTCDIDFENYLFYKGKSFLISVAFLTTNSVWNFFIYNVLNKKFRSSFIKMCFKKEK